MRSFKLLFLLPLFLISTEIEANHVLGGNVTWDCLGSNQYQVTLTMYKDCFGASTALNTENVFFFPSGCGAFPFNASLALISTTEISELCPSELANSSCVGGLAPGTQKLVYRGTVTLDANCTWKVIWNEGDWNYFNNINYATLPDAYVCATINTAYCVDSPVITSMQVPYECRNNGTVTHVPTFTIPAGVTASYSIATPQTTGASINSSIGVPGYTNTLGATVNAATGAVTINTVGQTVGTYLITIQITLTQGGNAIGTYYENMAFVIRDCASTPTTFDLPEIQSIQNQTQLFNSTTVNACAGDSICFTVAASNPNIQRNITLTATWPAGLNAGNPVFIQSTASTNPGVGEFCMATSSATIGTGFIVQFHAVDDACLLPSSDDLDITLNIYPSIQLSPVTATICANTPLNVTASGGTTYTWNVLSGDNTPGFDGNNANQILESISSNTVITATIPGVPAQCDATDTLTVFVTSFSVQPISSQTLCVGGTTTALSVAVANADPAGTLSYQWYSNTVNSTLGGSAIPGATSDSYAPAAAAAGTTFYYCVVSITGGGCPSITSTVSEVIVLADPTISTQPTATQTICVGGAPSNLTLAYSNGTGTATYQWYSNTTNSTTGGTSIAGATSATYAPPVINTAGNYYYYGIATLSGTGCGTATSAVAQVTVVADPTMTTQPLSTQTVCQSAPATALAVAYSGGTGVATYQWYSNTSNSTTGGTLIAGAVNASYTPATATVGTQYYYCIVTLAGTGCNTVTSSVATVVVTQGPSVSTQPLTTQTICAGGTVTQLTVAYSNGTGTPSYQWYSNTTNSTTGGTLIAGATNANYTPVAPTAGTTYYYCQISFTGGGCSSIVSNTATVAAVALPTITSQPTATQTICVGGAPSSLTLAYSNGTGTPTYQWYSNTTNSITGGTAIAGATAATYVPPVLNTAGSYFYYGIATLSGSGCGTTTTAVAQVTVVADPTITTQPLASQTVCQNGIATALTPVLTGGTGNFSYAWFTNLTNSTVGGIPSGSAATLNPITAVVGTAYVYCVITQSGLGCSTLTTTASQVTVVSAPTISTQPLASQSLCLNGIPTNLSVAYTNGTGTPSYQWYSNVNATNVGGTAIAGATNASYTPPTNTAGTFNYYCEISLSGAGCGSITSSAVQVIVNDLPTISTQPIAGGTICVGGTPPAFSVAYTGGSGTATYQWYSNATNSNTGGAAIVGATLDTFSAPALNTAGNYFYYATVSLTGAGCGSVSSNTTEVIVVDDATINGQPLTTNSVCEGAVIPALTFGTLNGTGLSTYQWYSNTVNSNSGGLALPNETNATFVPPASATGTTYYYCLINFSGSGCNSTTTATSEVIVVPQPSISTQPLSTQTICLDGIPNALTGAYSNGTGTPSFQWYSNATNTTTGGVLIPGATNDSYTPSGNAVGSQYYYLTVSLSGLSCNATTSASSEIVVVADPVISTEPLTLDSLCVGGNPNQLQVTITGGTGVTSYQWYSNINAQNTGGTAIPGETNATFTPPTSNAPGDYFYYVVGSLNGLGCDAVTSTVSTNTFVSDPSIVTQALTTQTLCVNDASTDLSFTYADGFGNPTIEWFSNASNSTIGGTLLTEVSNTLAPVNTSDGTTYYYATVTLSGNGCDAVTTAISEVIVNPLPTISITALQDSICFGQSTDLTATGAQDYQWTTDPTITTADNLDVISVSPVGSVTYVVTGTDAIGCVNTNSFTVYAADQLNVNEANVTTVCYATCTGEIDLTPNGGVPNYQVVWSDPTLVGLTLANLCPATYDYTLTDNLGCTFSNTIVITELPDNPIDNVILTQPLCFQDANGSVEIQDVNATSFNVFNALTGVGIGAQASGIFNNLSAGTYNVQIIDAQGCVFDSLDLVLSEQSAEIILTVDAQPNLFCFGQLVPLTATASGGDSNLTITWADCNNIPACVLGSGSPFNYNINQDITIYAQVIDGLGCLGTIESVALDMSDAISLQIQNGTLLEEICEGECVDMTAAVSGGNNNLTIQWYEIGTPVGGTTLGPDGLTNTICPPVSTGVYVYADDGCNAPASDTLLITVFEVPDVTFTVSAQEGCYPVTVQFNNTTDPNLIGNCIWTMGDGTTIADCSPQTYTYDEVGSYTPSLFVMSPDGCSSSTSLAAPINVWDYPVADFAWTPDPVNVLETEVQFSNLSVDGDTYDWTFATFGSSTEPNPMWTFPDVDLAVYPVCLETTNIHGCTNSICYEILIESILQIWVPNAFTPDNDGKNDVFLPVINGANPENYHFAIYDRWGTLMFETNNLGEAWIGNIRGGEYYPKSDSFVWRIEVEHLSDRRLEVLEGTVTLLR